VGRLDKEGTGETSIIRRKGKRGRFGYYLGYTFLYSSRT
jgi:hypothetical protein